MMGHKQKELAKSIQPSLVKSSGIRPPFVCGSLGDQGGSGFYRVLWPMWIASALGCLQFRTPPTMQLFPLEFLEVLRPDAILLHRPHTDAHRSWVNKVRHAIDALLVYTIDDWVGQMLPDSPHYVDASRHLEKDTRKIIKLSDRLIVSTNFLGNVYGLAKDTYVIPNYLPYTAWLQVYQTHSPLQRSLKPRIGWSGGISHPGDLKILRAIADGLGDSVQWVFLGMVPDGFNAGNSIIYSPVSTLDYPKSLFSMNLDIALAPLRDNNFNKVKTNLRILEYAACGYPVIASDVLPYQNAPVPLLPYDPDKWIAVIKDKLANLDKTKEEGIKLQEWMWTNYKLEDHVDEYSVALSPDRIGFKSNANNTESVPVISNVVDIVVTNYNNLDILRECVTSILDSQNRITCNLVIVDDGSESLDVRRYLTTLQDHGKATVIFNQKNKGYVESVNTGILMNRDRDVVILNNDTMVHGDWIDRLKAIAYSGKFASVTPISNKSPIGSYPNKDGSNINSENLQFYDSLAKTSALPPISIPTPVGFAVYLRRDALNEIGLFDVHAFGRGYGEENDWSMRAFGRGWGHLLATNVYVLHRGGATFKTETAKLVETSSKTIAARWTNYFESVGSWLRQDPIGRVRSSFDLEQAKQTIPTDGRTLYITHDLGGGAETYLHRRIVAGSESSAVIARSVQSMPGIVSFSIVGKELPNLPAINMKTGVSGNVSLFKDFGVKYISVQTTIGYDYSSPVWITKLASELGVEYEVVLHDYFTICPRLRMIAGDNVYCGGPPVEICNECVTRNGSWMGTVEVESWRKMYFKFLRGASKLITPSMDARARLLSFFPTLEIDCVPHESDVIGQVSRYKRSETLNVAVIGIIGPDKGSLVVKQCADYCAQNSLPIKFFVFGTLFSFAGGAILQIPPSSHLTIFGSYKEEELAELVKKHRCHISFFGSLWPETFSYTLSHAFKLGLPPLAFDIGAIADRIRDTHFGSIIPLESRNNISFVVKSLLDLALSGHDDEQTLTF